MFRIPAWLAGWVLLSSGLSAPPAGAAGGVFFDGSMGAAGAAAKSGSIFSIPSSRGTLQGGNLFHSFSQFDLVSGEKATFSNSGGQTIRNVFSRITGGRGSTIDGTIQSTMAGANLYFMNPKGIVFGPNAALDVSGSFHVTSGDSIQFGGTNRFQADKSQPSTLVAVDPVAFGFLGAKTEGITLNNSILRLPAQKDFSIVGGPISMTNSAVVSEGGNIRLISINGAEEVKLDANQAETLPVGALGTLSIGRSKNFTAWPGHPGWSYFDLEVGSATEGMTGGSIFILGKSLNLSRSGIGAEGGGTVGIKVADLVARDGAIVSASGLVLDASGNVTIAGINSSGRSSRLQAEPPGNITLNAANLYLQDGGWIGVNTNSSTPGGTLTVNTPGDLIISGENGSAYGIQANSMSGQSNAGAGGNIHLNVGNLAIRDGGWISTQTDGPGKGGEIIIKAAKDVKITGTDSDGEPSQIRSTSAGEMFGAGAGGAIILESADLFLNSGGMITSDTYGPGRGGNISIKSRSMTARDQSAGVAELLSTLSFGTDPGAGSGGDILLEVNALSLTHNGKIVSNTFGPGKSGNISIISSDIITIDGPSSRIVSVPHLYVFRSGEGQGGDITLDAHSVVLTNGGWISAENGPGKGGNIAIKADAITVDGNDSQDSAIQTISDAGHGGDISLNVRSLVLNGGELSLIPSSTGNGGKMAITVGDTLSVTHGGSISASAFHGGNNGTIAIQGGTVLIDGGRYSADGSFTQSNITSVSGSGAGPGQGGSVALDVHALALVNGGLLQIGTDGVRNAGNMDLRAETIAIDGGTGSHYSQVAGGTIGQLDASGTAGDIHLEAHALAITHGGFLSATTNGRGEGGNIHIKVDTVKIDADGSANLLAGIDTSSYGKQVGAAAGGQINLKAQALEVTNQGKILGNTYGAGKGGDIGIVVDGPLAIRKGGQIAANTLGSGQGGHIAIQADSVTIDEGHSGRITGISADTLGETPGSGPGGNLFLTARALAMESGDIATDSMGPGRGGNITIQAADVSLSGGNDPHGVHGILAASLGSGSSAGAGGDIVLKVAQLAIRAGAVIDTGTLGSGQGGSITLQASGPVLLSGKNREGFASAIQARSAGGAADSGAGGTIALTAEEVTLVEGGEIVTSTDGGGRAGKIDMHAGQLRMANGVIDSNSTAPDSWAGKAGEIAVTVREHLQMAQQSLISTEAHGGQGGNIALSSPLFSVESGSRISASVLGGRGAGGSIALQVDRLQIRSGGTVASNSASLVDGAGRAGSVTLGSQERMMDTLIMDHGAITSAAKKGGGGDITVRVQDRIVLNGAHISTSVQGGDGNGGNIDIDPIHLILNHSRIQANAYQGAGGKVTIQAQTLLRDPDSRITASSTLGIQGTVSIDTPDVNVVESLALLPARFFDASALLGERCATRQDVGSSRFILRGRGALPMLPGDLLASHASAVSETSVSRSGEEGVP
ncbi:MAG: filamentous hemagglutinin N-terminal domain-containing protein [Magnetococcus sp. MYC-9]